MKVSAKYLFHSGNLAGWEVINFHIRLLGNFNTFGISICSGWMKLVPVPVYM